MERPKQTYIEINKPKDMVNDIRVPDPLEGIIEGNNRQERYANFVNGTLAKIWPPTPESGEYGDDFHRSTRFTQGDITGYTHFSPLGIDPKLMDADSFETAIKHIDSPDYIRVRSIPPQLADPNAAIILVGGSCVIETHGVRTTTEIKNGVKNGIYPIEYLADVTRKIIEMAPTVTHISGAMLGGHRNAVHYLETDMWAEKVTESGIPKEQAQLIVKEAYKRINDAVTRRSQLVNPDAQVVDVNFDDLNLPEAIQTWLTQIGMTYDPDVRVVEVIHTYVGPNQLDLLKRALLERINYNHLTPQQTEAAKSMLTGSHHVRVKQIDHLRWGSMNLPKEVITRQREMSSEEIQQAEEDYSYKMGIAIMQNVYDVHMANTTTSLAIGFADLPAPSNGVQHESRDVGLTFKGKPGEEEFEQSVAEYLSNPARLHRNNVSEHLAFLKQYTIDNTEEKKLLTAQIGPLNKKLSPYQTNLRNAEQKVSKLRDQKTLIETSMTVQENIVRLADIFMSGTPIERTSDMITAAQSIRTVKEKALLSIQNKQRQGIELSPEDWYDLDCLPNLIEALYMYEYGNLPIVNQKTKDALTNVVASTKMNLNSANQRKTEKISELEVAQTEFSNAKKDMESQLSTQDQLNTVKTRLAEISLTSFPLSDNPYVHHAMQFLWDPDFVIFMREAATIQEQRSQKVITKDESNEKMRDLMDKIYPKLEAYINYLYGKTEYPKEMRYARIMEEKKHVSN